MHSTDKENLFPTVLICQFIAVCLVVEVTLTCSGIQLMLVQKLALACVTMGCGVHSLEIAQWE